MGRSILIVRGMAWILYALAAATAIEVIAALLSGRVYLWFDWVLIALLLTILLFSAAQMLQSTEAEREIRARIAKNTSIAAFVLYVLLLTQLLFFSRTSRFFSDWETYWNYSMVNYIPLGTILRYIRAIGKGIIPMTAFVNLFGNLLLFVPMGLLLPILFSKLKTFWRFFLVVLAAALLIELAQLGLRCGSCDVDDLLLNLVGAIAAFFVLRIPCIQRRLIQAGYFAK